MVDQKFKDPVESGKVKREAETIESQIQDVDTGISMDEFKVIPREAVRTSNPFDGYPETKVVIGQYKDTESKKNGKKNPNFNKTVNLVVMKSWVVALSPFVDVQDDPSGKGVAIGDPKKGNEMVVDIPPAHNRTVSYNMKAFKAVFDRPLVTKGGKELMICVVPDPIYRALIMFSYDNKAGAIVPNKKYMLWDSPSKGPLLRTYQMIINPQLKLEARIEEQFYGTSDAESFKQADMPGVPTSV